MLSLLLLGQLAAAQNPPPAAPPPPRRYTLSVWTTEEGLPQNSVTGIATDDDGFMWLTTWGGPVRFDGLRFTREGEELPNRQARTVVRSAAGGVLLATLGGGVWRIEGDRVRRLDTPEALPRPSPLSLVEDARGRVWVGTLAGLTLLPAEGSDGPARSWTEVDDRPLGEVEALAPAGGGGVWVPAGGTACRVRDGGEVHCLPAARDPGEATLLQLLETRDGALWTVWSDGRVLRAAPGGEGRPAPCGGRDPCLAAPDPAAMTEDRAGRVWIATRGRIDVLSATEPLAFTGADGLPDALPRAVFEDREGGMWLGLEAAGLVRLRPARVRMHGPEREWVGSVVPDPSGGVAASVPCGLLRLLPDGSESCVDILDGVSFRPLHPTGDGGLWVGTIFDGLFRWDDTRGARFVGLAGERLRALEVDRRGDLWIGGVSGIHRLRAGSESRADIERIAGPDDDRFGMISSFAEDGDGRMWIGSNGGGLSVFEGDSLRWLGRADGLTSVQISALHEDGAGSLWVGTSDQGLWRRFGGRFVPFDTTAGLPDRTVTQIVEDPGGDLWVGTNRGIARLPRDDIEAFTRGEVDDLDVISVDRADGMWSAETTGGGFHPSGLRRADGSLWFPTVSGLASIDRSTFRLNRVPPVVRVTGHRVEQGPVRRLVPDATVRIAPGVRSFEIQYTAVGFANPRRMRFRYRLAGFQDDWVDADTRRVAYYTRMRPGAYVFEVQASNSDGVWSPAPATVRVRVMPYFWETRGFLGTLLVGMVVGSVGLGQWWAGRRARRRMERLEREHALDRERSRIARDLHDDLGARLTRIAMLADLGDAGSASPVRVGDVARNAAVAMDELVWTIDARNDTVHDLAGYAARFAEQLLQPAGIACVIRVPPHLPRWPIGAGARRDAFLVFKEILNNAVKHSGAGAVEIAFETEPGWFRFSVVDDGRGFDPDTASDPGSNGLRNMEERVQGAGGRIAIESRTGAGTRVEVAIPVEPAG